MMGEKELEDFREALERLKKALEDFKNDPINTRSDDEPDGESELPEVRDES